VIQRISAWAINLSFPVKDQIMKEKDCRFEFGQVSVTYVEKPLLSINNDKEPGIDNLDGQLLRMVADCIATHICCNFNQSLKECVQAWKEAKGIPLPKNIKAPFAGSNSHPISLLPAIFQSTS
jgi:hypothetical protein